jgi:RNA ligase
MPQGFFKFPRTPHLWWPLNRPPKDDRVLDSQCVRELLSAEVTVEEKVDGANLGLSLDEQGQIRAQNRGSWVEHGRHSQFYPLSAWIAQRKSSLTDLLQGNIILFGEWCFAAHSIQYDQLPDWFLGFDIYDLGSGRFRSSQRRDEAFGPGNICKVPRLFVGRVTLTDLQKMLQTEHSRIGKGPVEGLYVRREGPDWLETRAKLVRPEFLSSIDEHWSHRPLEPNKLIVR